MNPASSIKNPELTKSLAGDLKVACRIARQAGAMALRYFNAWHGTAAEKGDAGAGALPVEWKEGEEPVTAADRAVSELCVENLHREFPDDAVVSEELPDDGARRQAARTWLVDPIDGTKDFIAGRVGYSIMIGLLIEGLPSLGVVFQPFTGENTNGVGYLWYATRGGGAFLQLVDPGKSEAAENQRLHVSSVATLSEARMVSSASRRENIVAEVRQRAGIRDEVQIGSIGIKLSLLAAGERDLYINPAGRTKLWDTCAPNIILHEAGGRLSDIFGRPLEYCGDLSHRDGLVASNGLVHEQALAQLAPLISDRTPHPHKAA